MSGPRRKPGLLGPQVEGYRVWLGRRGYTPITIGLMLKDFSHLGRWLVTEGLETAQLDEARMAAFFTARRAAGVRKALGPGAMVPVLTYLREAGVVPAAAPAAWTPLGELLEGYRSWMVAERGLAAGTVVRYENTARRFLQEHAEAHGSLDPATLTGLDVTSFLLRECARVSVGWAKGRVAELRSLLRFLYLQGLTTLPLATAIPGVAGWRDVGLPPPTLAPGDVQSLLDNCDRDDPVEVRDFAIIMLVARLGLRSIEVARLELADVDWRAGKIVVRGKGGRQDRLPLPVEVGEALVVYLSSGRNPVGARHVFLTCVAPRGPIRADLVSDVVRRACRRAGLTPVGAHRLRHALAGELLRRGAGLAAISQVLRHRDLATTALYAKVDLASLREVAQPWPGASR